VITLEDLAARRGRFALRDVTCTIPGGAYVALLGASGAGKTTLLEAVAGLLPARGRVLVGGRDVSDEPPERRGVGLVSQDALLFPHRSVSGNIGFALADGSRSERTRRVREAAELTGCAHLLDRRPAGLSGGERQRVALARAIVRRPTVLLLDEPLGALDAPVRREIRAELRALQRRLATTVLHVTHDLEEALTLADLLGVLEGGRLVQLGPPADLGRRPASPAVAALLGTENLIPGEIRADGTTTPAPFPARLRAGSVELRGLATREGAGYAAVRAEDITLSRETTHGSALNRLPGVVTAVTAAGQLVRVVVDVGVPLVAVVTRESAATLALQPGTPIHAHVKATSVHFI
jgi:molybdopterin-binding protein